MLILETPRVILRHLVPADLDSLWAIYADPEVVRYIPDAPRTRAEARDELEWHQNGHRRRPELGLWATIHKPSGAFIGRCGLLPWTLEGQPEVEVAYLLARAYWGQGLATEAAQAIVRYAFEQLHLARLVCLIVPGNAASVRVARKLGMTCEKELVDELGPSWLYARAR
jgi:ribosomal-protein-alanine N-acetyltransferase